MLEPIPTPSAIPAIGLPSLAARVFDVTPDLAVVITDIGFHIKYCNAAAERLFAHPASRFVGRNVSSIHAAAGVDNGAFLRAAAKVREGKEYDFQQKVPLADGFHFLDSRMAGLFDAEQLVGYALLSRDRTSQLRAETREHLLARTVADSPVVIIVTDAEGRIDYVNQRFTESTGFSAQEAIGQQPRIIRSGLTPVETYREMWTTILGGHEWSGELLNRHRDGTLRWHAARIMPIRGPHKRIEHFVGVQEDITERKASEETLRLSATVFENSSEAIMISDADNRIVSVNRAFSAITGYAEEEVIGQNPRILGSDRHGSEFFAAMWKELHATECWRGEIWDRRKSGEVYPKWLSITAVRNRDDRLTHYVAIFTDITERKAAEDRIAFLAYHDVLTGLPNRMVLRDRFEQAISFAQRSNAKVALLFLDLDHFKTINDTLGHAAGDELLRAAVGRLQECVRQTDTISRQGGDEFAILLPDIHDDEAAAGIASKILGQLAEPFHIDGQSLSTSVSIGISLYPTDGEDFDTLLKKADMAMYDAKDADRNGYRFFAESMNTRVAERLVLQNELVHALHAGEFLLHYQPQIDLLTGKIKGAEALLRWNSGKLGWLPPAKFIPVAEETGLIVPIGTWVLQEACRQAAVWQAAGLPDLVLAVNLSGVQLRRGDLIETVHDALRDSGLAADRLELELTESTLVQDGDHALEIIARLKSLGVSLAVDDFGTGYSSLAYLKRFAVDKLKIDQSFVRDILNDEDDAAIVRAIIQMAHSLKLEIIAEGVEDASQMRYLLQEGCDSAQGFYFGKPVTTGEFTKLLAGNVE